jgi:hypothetical protein
MSPRSIEGANESTILSRRDVCLPAIWSDLGRPHIIEFGQIHALHTLTSEDVRALDLAELPCVCNGLFPSDWFERTTAQHLSSLIRGPWFYLGE